MALVSQIRFAKMVLRNQWPFAAMVLSSGIAVAGDRHGVGVVNCAG